MQRKRSEISLLLYYVILSSLTSLVFILAGIIISLLFPSGINNKSLIAFIAILLFLKGGMVGFVAWFATRKSRNKEFTMKFIGQYLGRFFGLLIGGILGVLLARYLNISDVLGSVLGGILLYVAGWYIGGKLSFLIDTQMDKRFAVHEKATENNATHGSRLKKSYAFLLFIIYPWLWVGLAWMFVILEIPIDNYSGILPTLRIISIVCSFISIAGPWLLQAKISPKLKFGSIPLRLLNFWLGLVLSSTPSIFGFVLFVGVGASINEVVIFACVSSLATLIWVVTHPELMAKPIFSDET
jgi:hypothetical protein